MRIVFMGTPDFAAASLKKLIDEKYDIAAVFTQPDKPRDRGMKLSYSPVKELALENNIPVYQPTKLRDGTATELIKSLRPDILVVVAYGRILPDDMLVYSLKQWSKFLVDIVFKRLIQVKAVYWPDQVP